MGSYQILAILEGPIRDHITRHGVDETLVTRVGRRVLEGTVPGNPYGGGEDPSEGPRPALPAPLFGGDPCFFPCAWAQSTDLAVLLWTGIRFRTLRWRNAREGLALLDALVHLVGQVGQDHVVAAPCNPDDQPDPVIWFLNNQRWEGLRDGARASAFVVSHDFTREYYDDRHVPDLHRSIETFPADGQEQRRREILLEDTSGWPVDDVGRAVLDILLNVGTAASIRRQDALYRPLAFVRPEFTAAVWHRRTLAALGQLTQEELDLIRKDLHDGE